MNDTDPLMLMLHQLDSQAKHWTLKTMNREGARKSYECKVWAFGKRFSVQGPTPLTAINRALLMMSGQLTSKRKTLKLTKEPA